MDVKVTHGCQGDTWMSKWHVDIKMGHVILLIFITSTTTFND